MRFSPDEHFKMQKTSTPDDGRFRKRGDWQFPAKFTTMRARFAGIQDSAIRI